MGLNPNEYFSCSMPTQTNRVCRHFPNCKMASMAKTRQGERGGTLTPVGDEEARINMEGKTIGQAPEHIGVYRQSFQSELVKNQIMPCWAFYDRSIEWKQNQDVFTVLGGPGTTVPINETRENERQT